MIARLATADDFRAFFGKEPPEVWTALAGERDGKVIGIGGVVYEDGHAFGFLDLHERSSGVTLHRQARRFLAAMRAVGEPEIWTVCDTTIPRAADWLLKLGFKLLPDRIDQKEIWRWRCSDSSGV